MVSKKLWSCLLAVTGGVVAVAMLIGLADTSPALALARAATEPMSLDPLAQPPPPNKERFIFTATFLNNRDGTLWVRYEASRPEASFIIPKAAGTVYFLKRG